jgi:hypothetical protein
MDAMDLDDKTEYLPKFTYNPTLYTTMRNISHRALNPDGEIIKSEPFLPVTDERYAEVLDEIKHNFTLVPVEAVSKKLTSSFWAERANQINRVNDQAVPAPNPFQAETITSITTISPVQDFTAIIAQGNTENILQGVMI